MDDAGIEDDSVETTVPERIPVRAEYLDIRRNRLRRRHVLDVVVAADVVERNRAIEPAGHPAIFRDLRRISRLVHQVAGDDQERRPQPVRGRNRELEIRRLLSEIAVVGEHAELRVAELQEEERGRALPRFVGEVREARPVIRRQIVRSAPDVVGAAAGDERLLQRRHVFGVDRAVAPQRKYRRGLGKGEELAARVGPEILVGARDVDGARRDQRDQHVLIDRQLALAAGE